MSQNPNQQQQQYFHHTHQISQGGSNHQQQYLGVNQQHLQNSAYQQKRLSVKAHGLFNPSPPKSSTKSPRNDSRLVRSTLNTEKSKQDLTAAMLKQHQQQIIFNQNGVIIHNNYGQQNESKLQSNPNMSFQSVQDLENYCMELEIDRENQSRKISELEQWITCLSQSTLVAAGNQKEATSLQEQINYCLKRLDTTFKENFSLKKELAYEKKRFLDLLQAFNTLQVQAKQQENDKKDLTEKEQLIRERNQLQNTLQNLTAEVEFLSNKNEMFLRELKTKDFYSTYKDCVEELTRLREAHTILIGMIQNHHLDIGLRKDQSDGNDTKNILNRQAQIKLIQFQQFLFVVGKVIYLYYMNFFIQNFLYKGSELECYQQQRLRLNLTIFRKINYIQKQQGLEFKQTRFYPKTFFIKDSQQQCQLRYVKYYYYLKQKEQQVYDQSQ